MTERPLLSVIIPVYNVEKYLENCVRSVLTQTEQDFEIILVDDCSPDNSGKLCDKLAEKDGRIKVIHLSKNGGLGNARNTGLDEAKGQYIFFMDSDDTVSESLFSDFKKASETNRADVTVFGIHEEYFNEEGKLNYTNDISFGRDFYENDIASLRKTVIELEKKTLYGYAWNKIYSADLLKKTGVRFRDITLIEDIYFNVEFFNTISSLCILDTTPYNYKKRINTSLTNKFIKDYFKLNRQRVELILNQYKEWGLCGADVKQILADIYSRYIFSALQRNCDKRSEMKHKDRKEWLEKLFEDELWKELSPELHSKKSLQGILNMFLKSENKFLCLASGRFIFIVKEKLPGLFARAKANKQEAGK